MLKDADAVIHSMGILLEADYKGVLTGKESIWAGLSRAFSATKGGSQNPLERKEGEELRPQEKDGQLTYELMNRDSGTCPQCWGFKSHVTDQFNVQLSHLHRKLLQKMSPRSSSSQLPLGPRCCPSVTSPLKGRQNPPSHHPYRIFEVSLSGLGSSMTHQEHSPCLSHSLAVLATL